MERKTKRRKKTVEHGHTQGIMRRSTSYGTCPRCLCKRKLIVRKISTLSLIICYACFDVTYGKEGDNY